MSSYPTQAIFKYYARLLLIGLPIVAVAAILLSWVFSVPYIYTVLGVSAWVFFSHLITVDDELPGGFFNPDGEAFSPWPEVAIKGVIFVLLAISAMAFPDLRSLGA